MASRNSGGDRITHSKRGTTGRQSSLPTDSIGEQPGNYVSKGPLGVVISPQGRLRGVSRFSVSKEQLSLFSKAALQNYLIEICKHLERSKYHSRKGIIRKLSLRGAGTVYRNYKAQKWRAQLVQQKRLVVELLSTEYSVQVKFAKRGGEVSFEVRDGSRPAPTDQSYVQTGGGADANDQRASRREDVKLLADRLSQSTHLSDQELDVFVDSLDQLSEMTRECKRLNKETDRYIEELDAFIKRRA